MALTYAILGTGALGGYYGGQLAKSGRRVHFLLNSDYEHVQQQGLRVDTPDGGYTITPDTHDASFHGTAHDVPPADVVLICLKTTHNQLLPELLPKPGTARWKPGTVVVTLQNGLHPERDAAAVVGEEHVAGGLCFLCSNKVGPGHISYLDYGFIKLGAHAPGMHRDRLAQIAADFREAGVSCDVVDDLVEARWKKLVWNVPYNGLSVVLNLTTDKMMADPDVRERVVALMREVAAAAKAVDGKTIDEAFIQQMLTNTEKMAPYKTSMMLDHEAGRAMEVEAIIGDALRASRDAGTDPRWMYGTYAELRANQRGAPRAPAVRKAAACLIRETPDGPELLVFDHANHTQIPKGSAEPDEPLHQAVRRELVEETGVSAATVVEPLKPVPYLTTCGDGRDEARQERQTWFGFLLRTTEPLPDTWEHRITGVGEDSGISVRCRWIPLFGPASADLDTLAWPLICQVRGLYTGHRPDG